ncbi:DUF4129 domain-containing protein [Spirosoma rigui]|uniref:DUF4129 domain-containing protein n=1 Tax=Spirosoma rigui TaxID=564064 RepID=UPI0009B084A6|nr:DUF4129 domain-containing protein [Spirosoma rigui]
MKEIINRSTLIRSLLALLLVLPVAEPVDVLAQPKPPIVAPVAPDDQSPIRVRYPSAGRLRALQTNRDYQYGRDVPPPENPFARFWVWLWRKIRALLSSKAYQNVGQYVALAAIAGVVIYLLMKAEVLGFLLPRRARANQLEYENMTEHIHAIDFDAAIDEAVNRQNYRLGVRLLYLQTLKRLADADRIQYKPEKTNQQYGYDLANSPLQEPFNALTRQFEYAWYGNFPVDEKQFELIRQSFQAFNRPFVSQSKPVTTTGNAVTNQI